MCALTGRSGRLVDLGSGDGRIVLTAAKAGFAADGVELNPWLVAYSRLKAYQMGLRSYARFYCQDLWKFRLKPYPNIVIFGVEEMIILSIMMDVMKTEHEIDPFSMQESNDSDIELKKLMSERDNPMNLHLAWIKVECMDSTDGPISEIKLEETPELIPCTLKSEAEEESWTVDTIKEELNLEVTTGNSDFLTQSVGNLENEMSNKEMSQGLEMQEPTATQQKPEICIQGERRKSFKRNISSKDLTSSDSSKTYLETCTGVKPFKCSICARGFAYPNSLRIHFRIHTGEKPFKCDICEKTFAQSSSRNRHLRLHTDDT
ncbi:zinc finger protein 354C isoform X2 [Periplaneta americana]